jgi:hypothetical protein
MGSPRGLDAQLNINRRLANIKLVQQNDVPREYERSSYGMEVLFDADDNVSPPSPLAKQEPISFDT